MKSSQIVFGILAITITSCSPTDYVVEREIIIKAPANIVFDQINNHKLRDGWSPWESKDPSMKKTYEGTEAGKGAIYRWSGNDSVGTGMMEIVESIPNERIKAKLIFYEPWQSESIIKWTFEETSTGTKAVWNIAGQLPGYLFWMGQKQMEESMAPDFEIGLAQLKKVAEEKSSKKTTTLSSQVVNVQASTYYSITSDVKISEMNTDFLKERYRQIREYLNESQAEMKAPPFAIYHEWDEENNKAVVEAAIACESAKPGKDDIKKGMAYAGEAMKCAYTGRYDNTVIAHEFLIKEIEANGYEMAGSPWEVYVTDPETEPDQNKCLTEVYYPIKKRS